MILIYGADESTRSVVVRRLVDAGLDREGLVESARGELASAALAARFVIAVGRDAADARRALAALEREWPEEPELPRARALALENDRGDEQGVLAIAGVPSPWLGALVQSELATAIEALGRAEARDELERFLYIVSHDLLAPVRSIAGFTSLVQRRAAGKLEERLLELLQITQGSAESLQRMVLGLRDLSRVETRAGAIETFSLADLVSGILRERRGEIERSGAKIEVGELCSVDADPGQLRLLIDELLANALAHGVDGAQPEVSISARHDGDRVELLVADRGSTLDEAVRERIFEPFHQLDERESEKHAGIGLTICRAIARRHGATLFVRENEGGGNVFVLSMPRPVSRRAPVLA